MRVMRLVCGLVSVLLLLFVLIQFLDLALENAKRAT